MSKTYAAGILPITWCDGIPLFLVGKDVRDASFSDFGGKMERYDRNDTIATACREFYEETMGTIVSIKQIRARVNPETSILLRGRTQNGNPYYMYVVEIPYIPYLRPAFHKMLGFFRSKNIQRMYVEKLDVQWVTLHMLRTMTKRSVFANTLDMHAETLTEIGNAPPSAWRYLCKKHADGFETMHG